MKLSLKDPLLRFLLYALLFYIFWNILYEQWLKPLAFVDRWLIDNLAFLSSEILTFFGYDLIPDSFDESIRTVGIDGTNGLWIGVPCNGLTLFGLFTGFVLAYPGSIKRKIWFIPLGILSIHIVNLIRVICLLLIVYYFPEPEVLDFNHTYTFTLVVYSYMFYLWYLWSEKLSGVSLKSKKAPEPVHEA